MSRDSFYQDLKQAMGVKILSYS